MICPQLSLTGCIKAPAWQPKPVLPTYVCVSSVRITKRDLSSPIFKEACCLLQQVLLEPETTGERASALKLQHHFHSPVKLIPNVLKAGYLYLYY